MIFDIGIYQLDVDVEKTAAFYRADGDITCDCAGCRNYAKAVAELPASVAQFFHQFGIDPAKPIEVSATPAVCEDFVYYSGFYYICGTYQENKEHRTPDAEKEAQFNQPSWMDLDDDRSVYFIKPRWGVLDNNFPTPVIQMEIGFTLPWVLDEPNPYTL